MSETREQELGVHPEIYANPAYLANLQRRVTAAYFDKEWKSVERLFEAEIEEMQKRVPLEAAPVTFEEKQKHPWSCDMSRGDVQCPVVTPSGDGFLCCIWRKGHPDTLPHATAYSESGKGREWIERPPEVARRGDRQRTVADWCARAFGVAQTTSVTHRGIRFLEEAVEAAQAAGVDAAMAHKLIDHVFANPAGELSQELGGVGVTALALADAAGLDADECERREIERVLSKPLEHFAKRNQAKDDAGFNLYRHENRMPETPYDDECRWCAENQPEWSDDAKCWIHRRASVDKRCLRKHLTPSGEQGTLRCGALNGSFVCNLPRGHAESHQDVHPSGNGGTVGWRAEVKDGASSGERPKPQDFPCPRCGVSAGETCIYDGTLHGRNFHVSRRERADEAILARSRAVPETTSDTREESE